jgi:hypothetical protein
MNDNKSIAFALKPCRQLGLGPLGLADRLASFTNETGGVA